MILGQHVFPLLLVRKGKDVKAPSRVSPPSPPTIAFGMGSAHLWTQSLKNTNLYSCFCVFVYPMRNGSLWTQSLSGRISSNQVVCITIKLKFEWGALRDYWINQELTLTLKKDMNLLEIKLKRRGKMGIKKGPELKCSINGILKT